MSKRGAIAAWVVAGLLTLEFLFAGGHKLASPTETMEMFGKLGLPGWFGLFIGSAEVSGAIGLMIPRLRFWAAAGLTVIMVGAVGTHLKIHDTFAHLMPALLSLVLVGALAWVRRPRLASADAAAAG
jgi:uncharacterized membrane protein YphA (DoxX/SURF4 family)